MKKDGNGVLAKSFEENLIRHKGKNGRCTQGTCGGSIVKYVRGAGPCGYIYSRPRCEVCGHEYMFAGDVPARGHETFEKLMQMRFTI
jgi:hypothetical protein